ncbi:MAG TPA: LysR family transcriptional regulator [Polyangiaceae bacterium]
MPVETQELLVFHAVVKHSNYAKAADELGLSPSGVSRIVSRLEERLGARLIQRTTRKLKLTEVGQAFHARTSQVMSDLKDAEMEVQQTVLRPRGTIRISTSVAFGQFYLGPLLVELTDRYPELTVDLFLTDRFIDLIDEGIDLGIRFGTLPDSRLIARRLCTNHRVLVAAPSYLERRGTPRTPADLPGHECLIFTSFSKPQEWRLIGPDGPVTVGISGHISSNNIAALASAAESGMGITVTATMVVGPQLASGQLVRVLPQYEFEPSAIFAVYPSARQLSTKVRAVVDFLVERLPDPPPWDRALSNVIKPAERYGARSG